MIRVSRRWRSIPKTCVAALASIILVTMGCLPVTAQDATSDDTAAPATESRSSSNDVGVQLNKLETLASGCRAYVVVSNSSDTEFRTLKLDLVMFRPDGIIARRFAVDLAPLRKDKRSVKLFDLDGVKCEEVGSFLVNDVMECRGVEGVEADCLGRLSVTSLTEAKLTK